MDQISEDEDVPKPKTVNQKKLPSPLKNAIKRTTTPEKQEMKTKK
jgi:hypothetical protein